MVCRYRNQLLFFLCQYSSIFPKVLTVNANICFIKFLSCRNPKYGEEAKQELIEASGNSSIHLHILDMSLPRAVIAFTQGGLQYIVACSNCRLKSRSL